jgi:HTH-type transcriptional regulator/antitoxin HigA
MDARILKTDNEYQTALRETERLVAIDPNLESKDADRLELLTLLIEDYEKRAFLFDEVDAIDAIEFRMSEQGLKQKDLVPILGSKSRVSEILARKRPLTVQMIRSLSMNLGIPAESLIAEPVPLQSRNEPALENIDWRKFPVKEMEKRGWFRTIKAETGSAEDKLRAFLSELIPRGDVHALFRRKFRGTVVDERAYYSTLAWTARVLMKVRSSDKKLPKFEPSKITPEILRDLARLSWFENGPQLAVEFLAKCGIATVVEPRLPNAVIDGAAILTAKGVPVVSLTLRIDRIDYFWFTLLHEVAHVWKHLSSSEEAFIDRIDSIEKPHIKEKEANRIARDAFIRRAVWERSFARLAPTKKNIQEFADELHIHPAIVVGRLQFETGRYESFREFLGQGTVRAFFPDVSFI